MLKSSIATSSLVFAPWEKTIFSRLPNYHARVSILFDVEKEAARKENFISNGFSIKVDTSHRIY